MGYHVRIDESSQALLHTLTAEPNKVFGKLYSAYLLFLVTQHDKQQLDWIVANAPGLDALTGRYLAFAVFAKSFPIKIRTDAPASLVRAELYARGRSRELSVVSPELLKKPTEITRLVENGAFGVVLDGDELTAITYGSDLVARELGLLNKLPCLVVIDGVPAESPKVIVLTPKLMPELFQRLRGAVHRFEQVGGHKVILKDAEYILDIQGRVDTERRRDARLRQRISEEQAKLSKLREKASAPATTPDPNFFPNLVISRERALAELENELAAFPDEHPKREAALDAELTTAINEHRGHLDKTFSHSLVTELRSAGLLEGATTVKTQSMSFLANLFKPETLLKLWALVH